MVRSSWIGALVGVLACAALGQAQTKQAERFVMVREADKPAQKCRVLKCWKDKDGHQLCQVQAVDTGEMMTILDPTPTAGLPPARATMGSRLFRWGSESAPPAGTPEVPPGATVVASPRQPTRPSLWDRMFASSRPRVSTAVVQEAPASDKPTVLAATIETPKARAEQGKPSDWRQSWGKVERWTPEDGEKASRIATARAEEVQSSKPALPASPATAVRGEPDKPKPSPRKTVTQTTAVDPPKESIEVPAPPAPTPAAPTPAAPAPAVVVTPPAPKSSATSLGALLFGKKTKPAAVVVETTNGSCAKCETARTEQVVQENPAPVVTAPLSPPMVRTEPAAPMPRREEGLWAMRHRAEPAPQAPVRPQQAEEEGLWAMLSRRNAPKSPAPPTAPGVPAPGLGPVVAVTSPNLASGVPVAAGTASAPNAFTVVMPGAPEGTMPPGTLSPMMLAQSGVPEGMGNAFTSAGSTRPIPADLTRSYYDPNAFHQSGMGGAEGRPVLLTRPAQPTGLVMMPPPQLPVMPMPQQMYVPMPVPASPQVTTGQMLAQLRDSVMPSEREMAAEALSRCDWRRNPGVIQGLVGAAKADPAPAVRAACVRALGRMKVNTLPVVTAVTALKSDGDIRVRQEVEQALAVMSAP